MVGFVLSGMCGMGYVLFGMGRVCIVGTEALRFSADVSITIEQLSMNARKSLDRLRDSWHDRSIADSTL